MDNLIFLIFLIHAAQDIWNIMRTRHESGVETVIANDILNRFNFSWFSQSLLLLRLPVSRQSDASRKIARLLHSDILTSFTPRPLFTKGTLPGK